MSTASAPSTDAWRRAATLAGPGDTEQFGRAVALSADGSVALVGAAGRSVDTVSGSIHVQGTAFVFTHSGNVWRQTAQLVATDGAAQDGLGSAVALSANGAIALVGAPYRTIGKNLAQGAAYVFTRTGTAWRQVAILAAGDGKVEGGFGSSVALSANGNMAAIGAPGSPDTIDSDIEAAYIFTRTGGSWRQTGKLTASDGQAGDGFGQALAVAGNGATVMVASPKMGPGDNFLQGTVYVFARHGSAWRQTSELIDSHGNSYEDYGDSVALTRDGNTALIAAPGSKYEGVAYVVKRFGASWRQVAALGSKLPVDGDVALSGDGLTAVIGASIQSGTAQVPGAAFSLSNVRGTWRQIGMLTGSLPPPTGQNLCCDEPTVPDDFGRAVALDENGSTAIVGAYGDLKYIGVRDVQFPGPGHAFIFTR